MINVIWIAVATLVIALIVLDWEGFCSIFFSKKKKTYIKACPKCAGTNLSIIYPKIDAPMMIGEKCKDCKYQGLMVEIEADKLKDFQEIMRHNEKHVKSLLQKKQLLRFLLNPLIIWYGITIIALLFILLMSYLY